MVAQTRLVAVELGHGLLICFSVEVTGLVIGVYLGNEGK